MRDLFLFIHFIGLAMAVGTGFANLFLGAAAVKLAPQERGPFMLRASILVRMGQTGLGLLILSGFYLATPFWKLLSDMPTFMAKLALVVILLVTVTMASLQVKKARNENNPALLLKLKPLGMANFLIGIVIMIMAVLTFH
ncbi:MAG TPA: hypothetical protein VL728_11155 [Cyclobacteriaceae bacterium]|jgi:hypothetical protein|nr:hypothetical protein [Cyclobacteriaceae bacterium]